MHSREDIYGNTIYTDNDGNLIATGSVEMDGYVIRDPNRSIITTIHPTPEPSPSVSPKEGRLRWSDMTDKQKLQYVDGFHIKALVEKNRAAYHRKRFVILFAVMVLAALLIIGIVKILLISSQDHPDQSIPFLNVMLIISSLIGPALYGFFLHFWKRSYNAWSFCISDSKWYEEFRKMDDAPNLPPLAPLPGWPQTLNLLMCFSAAILEFGMVIFLAKAFWDQIHISAKAAASGSIGISVLLDLGGLLLALYIIYKHD